ncbi:MAG: gliding motility-associated C-terminal domain-containing protein [Bacteroidales bacterium]|nr:gliding motility-associated C-terminal domain-containing protein [Bacteroidales bacterium]
MKRIIYILFLLLLATKAFCYEPPTLQCLQQTGATTLRIIWSNSADCNHFTEYEVYINGTLNSIYTPTSGHTFCDLSGNGFTVSPSNSYSCYIRAKDEDGNFWTSNTLQTLSLQVTTSTDSSYAYLTWHSPSSNLDNNTWGNSFQIFKKHYYETAFPNQPIATVSTSDTTYTDTADVCYNYNSYYVSITNRYPQGEIYGTCPFSTNIGDAFLVDRTTPNVPVLDSVTVDENNNVALGFHAPDDNMYGFIAYYECETGWCPIDTIFGTTYWIDPHGDERCYRIAVLDSCINCSPMINDAQCNLNLYLTGQNECNKSADISWSTYPNLLDGIGEYEIFLSTDNGASYQSLGTTTANSYTITDLQNSTDYRVFVRVHNATHTISASSNRLNFALGAAVSPDFTFIRSVSVIDNDHIAVKVHTSGDTLPFHEIHLERSENSTDFTTIQTLPYHPNSEYDFADETADFTKKTYYYRTCVINSCNTIGGYSNIEHNILLQGEATTAQENVLRWNSYGNGPADVVNYFVSRKTEIEPTFNDLPDVITPSSVNTYHDDVSALFENGSKFLYYVTANISNEEYGFNDQSTSNYISLQQMPNTYIPNAFTPMEVTNNVFMPKNTFVPGDNYFFAIYARTGELVFHTRDTNEGWDGKVNGKLADTGVYVYKISYSCPNGTRFEKVGTVTLLY